MSLTMTPMTPAYFCHRQPKRRFIIYIIYYIIYNNATANYPHSQEINTPTVITVIVIAIINSSLRVNIFPSPENTEIPHY